MDNYNFYRSLYERELNRRKDLDAAINLPLTIISILITGNTYISKQLFPLNSICELNYKHSLALIFFLIIIFTTVYLIKSYNNFYKGFQYRNIGNYKEVRKFEIDAKKFNLQLLENDRKIDLENIIINKFVDIAENHCTINDKRSYDLYIAKTGLTLCITITVLNFFVIGIFK